MRRLALSVFLLLVTAAPAGADTTLAELARPTWVDAFDGRAVYRDAGRVWTLVGDAAPQPVPIDPDGPVDLGPGPRGAMVAAYVRDGDVYTIDFGDGRERRHTRTAAREKLPSVWKGRVAFVRDRRLWVAPLRSVAAAREVRGGRGGYRALDLHGRRVAFTRVRTGGDRTEWQLLTQGGRGVARLVDRAASGLLSHVDILRPEFEGGAIVYAIARRDAAGQRFLRHDLRTRRTREVVSRGGILSAAFDRGRFLYVQRASEAGPYLLRRTEEIAF